MLLGMEMERLLERHGYTVLGPAQTVAGALALLDHEQPDIALLDLNLNGESAISVAAALTKQDVPFVVVTGYGETVLRELDLQAALYLKKPVNHQVLVRSLAQLLHA